MEIHDHNLKNNVFKNQVISTFEMFTNKISSNLFNGESDNSLQPSENIQLSIVYKKHRNEFSDYYVDYLIFKLKNVRKMNFYEDLFPPFKRLVQIEKLLKNDQADFAIELSLICFMENEAFVNDRRIYRLIGKIKEIDDQIDVFKFFFQFLFAVWLEKDQMFVFNTHVIELIEFWILRNYKEIENQSNEFIFSLIFVLTGIFANQNERNFKFFTGNFLKLIFELKIWTKNAFWKSAVENFTNYLRWSEKIYFIDFLTVEKSVKKIKSFLHIYDMLLQIGVIFLKISLNSMLDILNEINEQRNDIPLEELQKISLNFESKWIEVKKVRYTTLSERIIKMNNSSPKLVIVLKLCLPFLQNDENIIRLITLNSLFNKKLHGKILKQFLIDSTLEDEKRIKIWLKLSEIHCPNLDHEITKSFLLTIDPKILNIIKMDVKRTNFAKFFVVELEKMLVNMALRYPKVNYYQGMNCIGGFLLNFLDNYDNADRVFSLLVKTRLEKYFSNNFENLKKLIYICERFVKMFLPRLYDHLDRLNISNVFYISPFILTIFTSFLQYFQNYNLIVQIMDVFIAKGWIGFFQILIYLFQRFEDKLIEKNYDTTLTFLNKQIYDYMFKMKFSDLKTELKTIHITKTQVEKFGMDFDKSRFVIENYWNEYYDRKRGFNVVDRKNGSQS